MLSILNRYHTAAEIYEQVADYALSNTLLKYGARGHLLNAGICQLCKGDIVAINNALERYEASVFLQYDLKSSFVLEGLTDLFSTSIIGPGSYIFKDPRVQAFICKWFAHFDLPYYHQIVTAPLVITLCVH